MKAIERVIVIVLDSVGIGGAPDAGDYGDKGADTLLSLSREGDLSIDNMMELGLGEIKPELIKNIPRYEKFKKIAQGATGILRPSSAGKDTIIGHWEMMGIIRKKPFPVYPQGFPKSVISQFEEKTGYGTIGNFAASGTEIIAQLGQEHLDTKKLIVYTSADSVFQIAAHEELVPIEKLYEICRIARDILQGEHGVARIIARPFIGKSGNFTRTENRADFALEPPQSVIDGLYAKNFPVVGVGKIGDIFGNRGFTERLHTKDNKDGMNKTFAAMKYTQKGLIFTNLVDFDMKFGHRRDIPGYKKALEEFDQDLGHLRQIARDTDMIIITADHGCDPAFVGTDHTRESVPLLVFGPMIKKAKDLGIRSTFSDIGATISQIFNLPVPQGSTSFLDEAVFR